MASLGLDSPGMDKLSRSGSSRGRSGRLAILLASATVMALWVNLPSHSFCTNPSLPYRLIRNGNPSWHSALPAVADASKPPGPASTSSLIFATGLATLILAAGRRRNLTARAATEKEDWTLETVSKKHAQEVKEIRRLCTDLPVEYDDVKLFRFAMQHEGNPAAAAENVKEVLEWRSGAGMAIVAAAKAAIAKATAGGGWDNKPVFEAAPHSVKISKYITAAQMVVVSTKVGDLITCIRAATIDSERLMKEVTETEMVDFFLYAREVNTIIAEQRTRATGHVARLISANDLTGVSKFPDQSFQNALTGSAKKAVTLYPGFSGPTVLLNLPWLARMLVSVLTPLFPGAVREKLKFARGPMAYMTNLEDIIKEPTRSLFVDDMQAVLNS